MHGTMGIGCISDYEPQPLIIRSHHGTYVIATVGKINNASEIEKQLFTKGHAHFLEMSGGDINATELVAGIINQKDNLIEGIQYAQEIIDGSMTILLLTDKGVYAARDKMGRTPVSVAKKDDSYCFSFESFAYLNLGYKAERELGPGEIAVITPEGVQTLVQSGKKMRICTFLWVYYGYPSSSYEGGQRGTDALQVRRAPGQAGRRPPRHRSRRTGFRHRPRHRLFQRFRHPLLPSLHQVHSHLAPLLYAYGPEKAGFDCQDEADSRSRAH